jgi:hypothetical protein
MEIIANTKIYEQKLLQGSKFLKWLVHFNYISGALDASIVADHFITAG